MQYKKYNENLKNKFDGKAKSTVLDLLISNEFVLKIPLDEQAEAYKDWDFIIHSKITDKKIAVECEVKTVWKESGRWQYSLGNTIHVPYRKKNTKSDIICVVNNNYDTVCVIPVDVLKKSDIISKNTKNNFSGERTQSEKFFEIEISKCHLYHKCGEKWKNLENCM